jgi:hypothetical protein
VECEITVGGAAGVDELKPLWLQMLSHHRDLVGDEFPVHAGEGVLGAGAARRRRLVGE